MEWSSEEKRQFRTYIKQNPQDYLPFTLNGTTFSGDPHTTLCNTFRSICYAYYYALDISSEPWLDKRWTLGVAGDDIASVFGLLTLANTYSHSVLAKTSRTNTEPSALGQCVKEVVVGKLDDLEFCSKWFFLADGRLIATRDYIKTLTTKQYYTRANRHFLTNPALHRMAILEGVKAEQASILIEDLL